MLNNARGLILQTKKAAKSRLFKILK